jgi:hypothetical protein
MNEPRIVHCPQCSRPFKSLRGLAQHITRRTACAALARPLLEGATDLYEDPHFPPSAGYEDTVELDDNPADVAMTPIWQEVVEGGPNNSLMDLWRHRQFTHVQTEINLADAEATVEEAVHQHFLNTMDLLIQPRWQMLATTYKIKHSKTMCFRAMTIAHPMM